MVLSHHHPRRLLWCREGVCPIHKCLILQSSSYVQQSRFLVRTQDEHGGATPGGAGTAGQTFTQGMVAGLTGTPPSQPYTGKRRGRPPGAHPSPPVEPVYVDVGRSSLACSGCNWIVDKRLDGSLASQVWSASPHAAYL